MVIQFLSIIFIIIIFGVLFLKFCRRTEILPLNDHTRQSLPGDFIHLPSGMTHYEFQGKENSRVVILIHGFSTPFYIWDPTFKGLVDAGYKVLRYDLFGRGFSDRPNVNYDVHLYRDQLWHLLRNLSIENPVHLIGLSYGGPIAADYAIQFPELVQSLTLIDPLVSTTAFDGFKVLNIPILGEILMSLYLTPFALPRSQPGDFFEPECFPEWVSKFREQLKYKGFSHAILSTIRNLEELNLESGYRALGKSKHPVLGIWGEHDQTISRRDMKTLENLIPQMELLIIKNAGHIPHYEQPGKVNSILIKYLGKSGGLVKSSFST